MKTYISILRGINVSGKRKIKMADLREQLTKGGFQEVKTYIQSGNIAFQSSENSHQKLAQQIHQLIETEYGYDVPSIVLDRDMLKSFIQENPFLHERQEDESKLHLTFLSAEAEAEAIQAIEGWESKKDEFVINDRAIYLFCPDGYGRTKLNNGFFEKKLNRIATTRNWKTVKKLYEMASE